MTIKSFLPKVEYATADCSVHEDNVCMHVFVVNSCGMVCGSYVRIV